MRMLLDTKIPEIKYTTNINEEVDKIAKKAYTNVKKYKPGLQHDYCNSFKLEKEKRRNGRYVYAISNKKKSMTWFLEKGHIIWNKRSSRVKAVPHIRPTVKQIKKDVKNILVQIKKGASK